MRKGVTYSGRCLPFGHCCGFCMPNLETDAGVQVGGLWTRLKGQRGPEVKGDN